MMLKIVVLASFLCAVRGVKYAYIGNQLVKFDDAPKKTFSFTYPNIKTNQGLQIIREQNTSNDDNVAETTEVSTIATASTTPTVTTKPTIATTPTLTTTQTVTTTPTVTTTQTVTTTPTVTTTQTVTTTPTVITTPTVTTKPTTTTTPAVTTTTTETQIVDTIPTLPGLISSLIWKIIIFVKKLIIKFITAGLSFIFGFISVPASYLTSMSKYYNIGSLPNMSQLSSLLNPERLKRAAVLLEKEIKRIGL